MEFLSVTAAVKHLVRERRQWQVRELVNLRDRTKCAYLYARVRKKVLSKLLMDLHERLAIR